MPTLAELLRNDPWGAPPQTPLAKTVTDVGFDPSLGFAGAVQTYLSRLKKMQGGLAQDMLDTAADTNAEGIQRAANLLGGLGLKVANVPMALMPSAQELRDRGHQSGASPEMQAVGGALGDMVNIPEPASVGTLLAGLGKAAVGAKGLAGAAAMAGKSAAVAPLGKGLGSLLADATPAEQAALKARLEAEAAQTGGQASSVSREQALNGLTGQDGQEFIAYKGARPYTGGPVINGNGKYMYTEALKPIDKWESPSTHLGGGYAGFFSSSPEVASRFAELYNPGAVFRSKIKFNNPYIIDAGGRKAAEFQFDRPGWPGPKEIQDALKNSKHDGVIIRNTKDEGDVYIPKSSAQISDHIGSK